MALEGAQLVLVMADAVFLAVIVLCEFLGVRKGLAEEGMEAIPQVQALSAVLAVVVEVEMAAAVELVGMGLPNLAERANPIIIVTLLEEIMDRAAAAAAVQLRINKAAAAAERPYSALVQMGPAVPLMPPALAAHVVAPEQFLMAANMAAAGAGLLYAAQYSATPGLALAAQPA